VGVSWDWAVQIQEMERKPREDYPVPCAISTVLSRQLRGFFDRAPWFRAPVPDSRFPVHGYASNASISSGCAARSTASLRLIAPAFTSRASDSSSVIDPAFRVIVIS
jgi:hypothetical protein